MATLKDVAKLAGVSYGTVSNVLNGNGKVSSAKIMAVQQAAQFFLPSSSALKAIWINYGGKLWLTTFSPVQALLLLRL